MEKTISRFKGTFQDYFPNFPFGGILVPGQQKKHPT